MRKFLMMTAGASSLLLMLGIGIWTGAVYHDRLEMALRSDGSSGGQSANAVDKNSMPQMKASADQPPSTGKQLYHCGMHPWIIQDHPGTCPICHMELTPVQGGSAQIAPAEKKVLYYWDPMLGPSSISSKPGKSAMGMDLVPVYADQVSGGPAVSIDPAVVQNMGVQTALVKKGTLEKSLRTVGYLDVPETGLYDITVKVNGYIDKLYANRTGMHLHKGDPLFDLYSPDLVVAEDELIAARKAVDAMTKASPEIRKQAQGLMESARRKLQLLDISDEEIDKIAQQDHAVRDLTFRSPADGHLEDKMIVQGSSVQAGMKLMRIEDHGTMWLEAQVYEEQLPLVKLGETAEATLDALPDRTFSGKIIFINPHLDHMNRTVAVRIALDNPDFLLKPGMYATVHIHASPIEDALIVPHEAVIDTGTRKIAFVQEAEGHFSPRLVTTGLAGDNDQLQVLSGLAPGETVVTSGQFLLDVESRTLEAIQKLQTPEPPAATMAMGEPTTVSQASAEPMSAPATTMMVASGRTDELVKTYLAVAAALQQEKPTAKSVDLADLIAASMKFADTAPADEQPLARKVTKAVTAMKDQSLEQQRKSFEKVGAAIVPLVEKDPPSTVIGGKLYVANCPMENADWLQTQEAINNPFLPSMRSCGSITRTLSLNPAK
jgi:membrane fusion protein, copper/silver efflux system